MSDVQSAPAPLSTAAPAGYRILVPVDGSPAARGALDYAMQLPASQVTLLHVTPDDLMLMPGIYPAAEVISEPEVTGELEALASSLRTNGRAIAVDVRVGDPAEAIIAAGTEHDLVVMGTHGRGAASRLLFGSVADRVSRHASTPTLMIRPPGDDKAVPAPARIVAPLDGSDRAERALPIAASLARSLALPLHLLRIVDIDTIRETLRAARKADTSNGPAPAGDDAAWEHARRKTVDAAGAYLAGVAAPLTADGIETVTGVLEGSPAFVLLWNIAADDLVVMTSHGRHGFRRWLLGSVAEKLVREAKGPVLLVPTREAADS